MALNGIPGSPAAGIDNVLAQLRLAQQRTRPASATPADALQQTGASAATSATRGVLRLSADDTSTGAAGAAGAPGGFAAALKASLDQVSAAQGSAAELGKQYEKGQGNTDLNDVMLAMQKANVGFQAAVQVRNRLVSAYQTIMNMQI